jgi:hypothetical protein
MQTSLPPALADQNTKPVDVAKFAEIAKIVAKNGAATPEIIGPRDRPVERALAQEQRAQWLTSDRRADRCCSCSGRFVAGDFGARSFRHSRAGLIITTSDGRNESRRAEIYLASRVPLAAISTDGLGFPPGWGRH